VAKSIVEVFLSYKNRNIENNSSIIKYDKVGEINKETVRIKTDELEFATIRRNDNSMYKVPLVIELTPYLLTPAAQNISAKTGLELDMGFYGKSPLFNCIFWGAAVGYDYNRDTNDYHNYSYGPMGKMMFELQNTGLGIDLYTKFKTNNERGKDFKTIPYGARINFSLDFVQLFIGIGDEPRYSRYHHVTSIYTGFTLHYAIIPDI
jgi:hypothetical protein